MGVDYKGYIMRLVLLVLLVSLTSPVYSQESCSVNQQKGVYAEAGKIIAGAIVGEVISRTVDRMIAAPSPRPTPPAERREPIQPSHGPDPRPEPCPAAGGN